ncbi:WD40 repeat-like protein [Viridothelium virens]|uniref:WD40 repeat-like protein n=1 Tax=Viridothelium virens TaxID=1048519 RepID=A0A6A6HDF0_VIRVR|nr:WD40 repeat-like protein [Viridothelium virens]
MNQELLDPFILVQELPEVLSGKLRSGHATCIRFNRGGDLLASGRADGTVIIFDVGTNGIARKLRGHTRQIQSLSWSANGRYLLSASQDWKCVLWDLQDGSRVRTVKFQAPVFIAELHPHDHFQFVAALFEDQPVLVDISSDIPKKRSLSSAPHRTQVERENVSEKQAAQDAKQQTTVATFTGAGNYIFTGTRFGWINMIDTRSCETIYSTRLSTKIILFIRFTASGQYFVVNASDGIIRTLKLPSFDDHNIDIDHFSLEVEHKFQDVVNRHSWSHVAFSPTGDYVAASTFGSHDIYIWERKQGSLVKILALEDDKEEVGAVEWHPERPFIVACGASEGEIYLWSIQTPQRWSALAPDFAEVEENVEYVEPEDEFDIHPIEELHKRRLDREDEPVDVLTIDRKFVGMNDSQFRMPVLLDVGGSDSEDDIVAIGAGQFRRRTPGQGKDWAGDESAGSGEDQASRRAVTNGTKSQVTKRRRGE